MGGGFVIGRLFGISIRLDWSWIFIFAWVTLNLAVAVFPSFHPDWGPQLTWGIAIVASLLFFASVLAHELAHSLVARSRGLPVENITLFLFGGVSNIQQEPSSPQAEFLITIVGPLTSIILGVIFVVLSNVTGAGAANATTDVGAAIAQRDPLSTLFLWLGPINIILGLFNLIPGFPLDGGRILRSVLWAATNNLRKATRWAASVGQGVGWVLIALGILIIFGWRIPFFGTGFLSGLWAIFIGWFLNNAATQSYRQVVIHDVLGNVPVARLMTTSVPTAPPEASISSLIHEHMMGSDDHAFMVMDGDRLVGLVCLDDVRKVPRDAWDTTTVADIMTPAEQLIVATPEENAGQAFDELVRREVNQLPVLRDGQMVGLLRRRDVLRWLQFHADQMAA